MLIRDVYTLQTVNPLYLTQQIILNSADLFDLQQVMRIDAALGQLITSLELCTVRDLDAGAIRDQIRLFIDAVRDDDLTFFLRILDRGRAAELRDDRKSFRLSRLKKLLDTRKTLCDIITGNAAAVKRSHGELCSRLTDRLCRDDADSLTDLDGFTGRHVGAIAFRADPDMGLAAENVPYLYLLDRFAFLINAPAQDPGRPARRDHMVLLYEDVPIPVPDVLAGISSCDPVLQTLDRLFAVHERRDFHTRYDVLALAAVDLTDDQFLANVDHPACQITGVRRAQRCIGHTFPCTVR